MYRSVSERNECFIAPITEEVPSYESIIHQANPQTEELQGFILIIVLSTPLRCICFNTGETLVIVLHLKYI